MAPVNLNSFILKGFEELANLLYYRVIVYVITVFRNTVPVLQLHIFFPKRTAIASHTFSLVSYRHLKTFVIRVIRVFYPHGFIHLQP